MRIRLAVLVTFAGALVAAPLVLAQVQSRYQVASDPEARGYPRSLVVVIDSPPDYVLDFVGRLGNDASWKGPRYQATGRASLGGDASLEWSAGIYRTPSNRQTIVANLVQDWDVILEGTEPIFLTRSRSSTGGVCSWPPES